MSLMLLLHMHRVVELSMDRFYKGLTPEQRRNPTTYNFDHPGMLNYRVYRHWTARYAYFHTPYATSSVSEAGCCACLLYVCLLDAFDWESVLETLDLLKKGQRVQVPVYSFTTHSRLPQTDTLYGADIIIFEGIYALYDERVRKYLDLKIFVDTDADLRLARRCKSRHIPFADLCLTSQHCLVQCGVTSLSVAAAWRPCWSSIAIL